MSDLDGWMKQRMEEWAQESTIENPAAIVSRFALKLMAERDAARASANTCATERDALRETLEMLVDHQNGCPLPKYEEGWNEAMRKSSQLLGFKYPFPPPPAPEGK